MAEQAFATSDVERILKALFPRGAEDPFGELRGHLVTIQEELQEHMDAFGDANDHINEELSDIKSRTFGILILQVIRILKTLMSILPAGRFILLAIAAMGLVATFMDKGEVSVADVKTAVKNSGLEAFVSQQLNRLTAMAEAQAQSVEAVLAMGQPLMTSATSQAGYLAILAAEQVKWGDPENWPEGTDFGEVMAIFRINAEGISNNAAGLSNLTANIDTLIFGTLEQIPQKIRELISQATSTLG